MSTEWNATSYDRVADPQARWGAEVLERLPLDGAETVLDAGCGTGRVTELLLDRLPLGRVVALDQSGQMLDEARRRLARFGDRVDFVLADLGRPLVDTITGSSIANLKELRPGSVRILFVFDPWRSSILLVAGDKAGRWNEWYREAIPLAEQRYEIYLKERAQEQGGQ